MSTLRLIIRLTIANTMANTRIIVLFLRCAAVLDLVGLQPRASDNSTRSAADCAGCDALLSLVPSSRKVSGAFNTHAFDQGVIAV